VLCLLPLLSDAFRVILRFGCLLPLEMQTGGLVEQAGNCLAHRL
jgi:hypothetical protein